MELNAKKDNSSTPPPSLSLSLSLSLTHILYISTFCDDVLEYFFLIFRSWVLELSKIFINSLKSFFYYDLDCVVKKILTGQPIYTLSNLFMNFGSLPKKVSKLKLYLLRWKWPMNETLIFLKIVSLAFNPFIPVSFSCLWKPLFHMDWS